MSFIVDLLMSFLMLGCMYALVAVGFTMYVGVIRLPNLSHGDTCVVGAFALMPVLMLLTNIDLFPGLSGLRIVVAIVAAAAITALWGLIVYWVVVKPLLKSNILIVLIATIAAGQVIREAVRLVYPKGSNPQPFPQLFPDGGFQLMGSTIRYENLIILGLTVLMILAVNLLVMRTKLGLSMRAVSQNSEVAQIMGISLNRTVMLVFIIGAALAATAGIFNGAYYQITKFDIGSNLGIKGFSAAVIGGLGNNYGAVIGAVLLSLVEVFSSALIPGGSQYQHVLSFVVVILFLVFRPSGIMGEKTYEKV